MSDSRWEFGIDRGGTFTDIIGRSPHGEIKVEKILSESVLYKDAGFEGIRKILGLRTEQPIPEKKVKWIRMGTTVATNALLEKKGSKTALIINKGFCDLIEIGTQDRDDIFALHIKKPKLLYDQVYEIQGRINALGQEIAPLDKQEIYTIGSELLSQGFQSIAVVTFFSWKNAAHELLIRKCLQNFNFDEISLSHQIISIDQAVKRGRTTILNAYLNPILQQYVNRIKNDIGNIPLYFMGSSGSLFDATSFCAKEAVLSGPAGGVLALENYYNTQKSTPLIGFDMGGTSTDISRYDGHFHYQMDHKIADIPFTYPMLKVDTVAAGGGSIITFDGERLQVGPDSAGAFPGPACYANGGPLTVTDANLVLGRIQADFFPRVFGPKNNECLNISASISSFKELQEQLHIAGYDWGIEKIAQGCIEVANQAMARPIRDITIGQGHDVRNHTLLTFGGAGAQNACGLADILDIERIIIPEKAGILSAEGILNCSPLIKETFASICPLNQKNIDSITQRINPIIGNQNAKLCQEYDIDPKSISVRVIAKVQIKRTNIGYNIYWSTLERMIHAFNHQRARATGIFDTSHDLEIASVSVESTASNSANITNSKTSQKTSNQSNNLTKKVYCSDGKEAQATVYYYDSLLPEKHYSGPSIILTKSSTIFIDKHFYFSKKQTGELELNRMSESKKTILNQNKDPVLLEVFNHLFMGIGEQMGKQLIQHAQSVNMRERKDFSCALFDSKGRLIANAPHIPVHLGAMGETVKSWLSNLNADLKEGEYYATNDPYSGGSHLPDITVISPVFRQNELAYCIACRGHHADVGGIVPGSMPPFADSLLDEGIVLKHELIANKEGFRTKYVNNLLSSGTYPARNIPERVLDLKAQIHAVNHGISEIHRICDKYGDDTVIRYTQYIRENAYNEVQKVLNDLSIQSCNSIFEASEVTDEGQNIKLKAVITKETSNYRLEIDFSGTSKQQHNNLNAPQAVCKAAVLYVIRSLIDKDIPLNDGSMDAISIFIPPSSMLNPDPGFAVSGGNVETSQMIVDALFIAFQRMAQSQGTMNNVLFGDPYGDGNQYYETIAGGMGASKQGNGASAIQIHMTNTSITDPETLEMRFPQVKLQEFSIRKSSGGIGLYNGGDGVVRIYEFVQDQEVSVISQRRIVPAKGIHGGLNGALGNNKKINNLGEYENLPNSFQQIFKKGESLIIETPGGGGYGKSLDNQKDGKSGKTNFCNQ